MTAALPWLLGCLSFVVSMSLAAPGLTWLDGGELALAAGSMGVAHPPGEPAYLVLAKLASLVPIGDLPFRLTVFSAATVAMSVGLVAWITSRMIVTLLGLANAECRVASHLGGGVAALAFLLAPGVQLQAVRPELYGLTILLLLLAVAALHIGGRRGLALAVLPLCVAGAVHHAMLVAAIPGLGMLALGRGKGSLKAGGLATALLLVPGLLQFAWLPLRSFTDPALDFGTPRDLERILWSVSAAGYARSFQPDGLLVLENLVAHGSIFVRDLGWPVLGLTCVGGGLAFLRARRVLGGCLLIVGVGLLPTVLQGLFREDNPDARGYLLAVYATLCVGAGVGAALVATRLRAAAPRLRRVIVPAFAAVLLVPAASGALVSTSHTDRFLPSRLGAMALDAAQPGALVLLAGDSWSFPALYTRYWEGRRPDLEVRPLYFLDGDVIEGLEKRGVVRPLPHPGPSPEHFPSSSRPEQLLLGLVTNALPSHPVQTNEAFLPSVLAERREDGGLLYRFSAGSAIGGGEGVSGEDQDPGEGRMWRKDIAALREDPRYLADPIGPGVLTRRYSSRAGYYLETGRVSEALMTYRRGSSLASDPWDMVHLLRSKLEHGAVGNSEETDSLLRAAEEAFLLGDVDRATLDLAALLRIQPTHPRGLLLAERLYSLGHRADRVGHE